MSRITRVAVAAAFAASAAVAVPAASASASFGSCTFVLAADHLSFTVIGDRNAPGGANFADAGHYVSMGFTLNALGRKVVQDPYQSYIDFSSMHVSVKDRVCAGHIAS